MCVLVGCWYVNANVCESLHIQMRKRTIRVRMCTGHGLCACLCEGIPLVKCSAESYSNNC